VTMRSPVTRIVFVAECAAWLLVILGVGAVFANLRFARELIRGAVDGRRLPHEELAPRDLLMYSYAAVDNCLGAKLSVTGSGQTPVLRYDPFYHARISRAGFSVRDYPSDLGQDSEQKRLAACVSAEVFRSMELGKWERVEPRIMWVYFYIESRTGGTFATWPAFNIPESFRPWERPWAYDQILRKNGGVGEIGNVRIFSTKPYKDAFTGETILSLSTPVERIGYKISLAVDVRAGAGPGLYSLSLLFNLFVCLSVAIGSFFIAREFRWRGLRAWYGGWLTLSALYSYYIFVFFARGDGPAQSFLRSYVKIGGFVLSTANSVCFCLAGVLLMSNKVSGRLAAWIWGGVATIAVIAAFIENIVPEGSLSPVDVVEAVISFLALSVLGLVLALIAWRCGAGHHSSVLRWARPTIGLVVMVFFGYAVLQLSIPFFGLWPVAEELFWPAAVLLKVSMVAVFFVVILLELYLEKVEVNEIFLRKFPEGIFAVDAGWRVSNVNDFAVAELGLTRAQIRGRHLSEVLFASWFEAEHFYEKLLAERHIDDFSASVKRFTEAGSPGFETCDRKVSAVLVGASEGRGKERAHALVFLQNGST
jgi:PAS domain-containing protein